MIDQKTPALQLPLPHPDNELEDDVLRLRAALTALDAAVSGKATPADIAAAIASLVDTAPGALDTLRELAAALNNDPNFAATVATQLNALQARATAAQQAIDTINTTLPQKADSSALASAVAALQAADSALATSVTASANATSGLNLKLFFKFGG